MSLFTELRRRNVFRVAAAYVVTAWLVIQVVETILPAFGYGNAAVRYVTIAFAVGLIPVLVLSWVFEWTPEGIRREAEVDDSAPASIIAARRLDRMILVVLALALGYFAFDRFVVVPQREAVVAEEARQEGRAEALVESYGDLSIAVLPFDDMSPDGDQEYLSDGIAEELLNLLARVPELRVTSRTSSFAFRGQALEVPEIAKRLKVGHILEGSVRKAGNQIRITAQLIEARSDTHLWSETWDRTLENVFEIQDEIAKAVVASLQTELLGTPKAAAVTQPVQTDPRAYELVLRGRYLLNQQRPEVLDQAQAFYEQAIEAAPDYAPAWGGLSKVLMAQSSWKRLDPAETGPRIDSAVRGALELDPRDPDALSTRGRMFLRLNDTASARQNFQTALSINPNDSDAYRWLALSYGMTDPARYLENMRRAYLVDPTNMFTNWQLIRSYRMFGKFDEAMAVARDFYRLDPANWRPLLWAADTFRFEGRDEKAMAWFYHLYRTHPDQPDYYGSLVWFHVNNHFAPDLTAAWIEEWKSRAGDKYLESGTDIGAEAGFYVVTGHGERAVEFLQAVRDAANLPAWAMGLVTLRATKDYARARAYYEEGIGPEGLDRFDPGVPAWSIYVDYVLILQKTGESERALALADQIRAFSRNIIESGVVLDAAYNPIQVPLAELEAILGNVDTAVAGLREVMEGDLPLCLPCLRIFPHYDNLRGDPGFESLLSELEEEHAATVARLESDGLLLYPNEVMAIEDYDFEPFEAGTE